MFWVLFNPFLMLATIPFTNATTNVTIDDTDGDSITGRKPVYEPAQWQGPECTECAIQPDRNRAFRGTWSALTYSSVNGPISITLSFKGTAVYVYFIIPNTIEPVSYIATETACEFNLDGNPAGIYNHTPTSSLSFDYNTPVYINSNLQNNDHKLIISTSGIGRDIFLAFDYAIYTADDVPSLQPSSLTSKTTISTSSASSALPLSRETQTNISNPENLPKHTGSNVPVVAIVGAVIGFMVIVGLALLYLYCRKKLKLKNIHHVLRSDPLALLSSDHPYRVFDFDPTAATPVANRGEPVVPAYVKGNGMGQRNTGAAQVAHRVEPPNDMAALRQEMRDLKTAVQTSIIRVPAARPRRAHGVDAVAVLQSQTRVTREQVEHLRVQQPIEGPSEDPPAYSTLVT